MRRSHAVRWAGPVSNWLLVVLVAVSLALAALLWSIAPPPFTVGLLQGGSQPYATPESVPNSLGDLLMPVSIDIAAAGSPVRMVTDSPADGAVFDAAWKGVLQTVKGLSPQDLQGGAIATWDEAAAALTAVCPASAGTACAVGGFQLQFATALPWAAIWEAADGGDWPATAPDPSVRRLVLTSGANGTQMWVLSAAGGLRIAVSAAGEVVLEKILGQGAQAGSAADPLAAGGALNVVPGIYVPAQLPSLAPVSVLAEQLAPDALAGALFPDLLEVSKATGSGGATAYHDPQGRALTVNTATGTVRYIAPPSGSASGGPGDTAAQLFDVYRFVTGNGGWPPEAFVFDITSSGGSVGYGFGTRYHGYPVVGSLAPIFVDMRGVTPLGYDRQVPVPGSAAGSTPSPWIAPDKALQTLATGAFVQLPQGTVQEVSDVFPAFYETGTILRPVWAVAVHASAPARGGLALVDASSGDAVAFLPGQ